MVTSPILEQAFRKEVIYCYETHKEGKVVVVYWLFLFPESVCLVNTGLRFQITGSFNVKLAKGINFC